MNYSRWVCQNSLIGVHMDLIKPTIIWAGFSALGTGVHEVVTNPRRSHPMSVGWPRMGTNGNGPIAKRVPEGQPIFDSTSKNSGESPTTRIQTKLGSWM